MARPRSIDREHVLNIAEQLVTERGAGALSIGSVAQAAGITKGGVQSSFGTKEALIAAMLHRWITAYERELATRIGEQTSPLAAVAAHVDMTQYHDEGSQARAASLLAVLIQSQQHLSETQDWYRTRIAGLNPTEAADRRARLAFLATEGAFFLRFMGLLRITPGEWDSIFDDVRDLISGRV